MNQHNFISSVAEKYMNVRHVIGAIGRENETTQDHH